MTGNDLLKYLKKPIYNGDNNLFTDIIKSSKKSSLNEIQDVYLGLKDREDAIIICLAPIEHLVNQLCKRVFYSHSSFGIYYSGLPVLPDLSDIKQHLVVLNFEAYPYHKNRKLIRFKIPVFYSETFQDYQAIILTTKYGNKEFVIDIPPEYNRSEIEYNNGGYIYNYPKNSPFNLK